MKFLGKFKCPKCGWVHIGLSEANAAEHVASCNAYYDTLDNGRKAAFGQRACMASYLRCFRCGAPSADFVPATEGDAPTLSTLQAVIAPTKCTKN